MKKNINELNKDDRKAINKLARKRFEERMLNDILCDLMICEIEMWDKKEYLNELKELINSIGA